MEFFIDTANIGEIQVAADMGLVDGVTTNPSLMAKEGKKTSDVIPQITEIVDGPISAEVVGQTSEDMIKEGMELAKIHKNIVIKIPMTDDGLKALKHFSREGIKTNVTLVFSATQGLLAAKGGATYVSPFLGRLDDIGHDGMLLIEELRTIFDNFQFKTKILAASIRGPGHVKEVALRGADVATIPPKVLKSLIQHPLTDKGLATFLNDYKKVNS